MKFTILGSGTSQGIPVIGCHCQVCQSTDPRDKRLRVSLLVEAQDKTIVIDSGPDFRYQMLRAGVQKLDALIFTHEHKDHIAGMDDIRAFNFKQGKSIDVYAHPRVQRALEREFAYIFNDQKYPGIPEVDLFSIHADQPFRVEGIPIEPVEVMHYKMPVLGFRIGDFCYLTDAKTVSDQEKAKLMGLKVLVVNALQKEKHISHFTLEEAIAFAQEIGAEKTYLTHISHRMGPHADVSEELPEKIELAYDGLVIEV